MGFLGFLRTASSDRWARTVSAVVSALFMVVYVLMIGIVFPLPYQLPESFPTPSVETVFDEPFGQYPMLVVYIDKRWVFSINPEAFTAVAGLTALVAFNTAAISYVKRHRICRANRRTHLSWMAVVPSFFSFFTCCGGGVVFSLLLSVGAGLSVLGFLQDYGRLFTMASAMLLTINLYLLYRDYLKGVVTFSSNG
ncbi:MAG: hypothetical protein RMI49_05335 [Candidatus Caldarchaeum sp.]|nr:hypothetical protein [Candidatus Caldarchaeum sp.]